MSEIKRIDDIRDFFTLNIQAEIIKAAQNYNNFYEETVSEFAKLFYAKLCQCMNNTDLNDEKNLTLISYTKKFLNSKVECSVNNTFTTEEERKSEGQKDKEDKEDKVSLVVYFFQKVIWCYKCWCTCDLSESLRIVENLLEKAGTTSTLNIKKGSVFYRGRMTEECIDKSEMFHIPFKKSYLIKNQRFSVTGQPVLYITDKLDGLISELELRNESDDRLCCDLHVSRFEYNDSNKGLNIFDFRIEKKELDFESYERFEEYMYRFMISCVCSFPAVHKGAYFVEEYIIPQLFTQVVRNKYDGVCYQNINSNDYENYVNYVLFTSKERVDSSIDEKLRDKFYISSPITAKLIEDREYVHITEEKVLEVLKKHFDRINKNKKTLSEQQMDTDIVQQMRTYFDGKSTYVNMEEKSDV